MDFWRDSVDRILDLNEKQILTSKGKISHVQMESIVDAEYEKYDSRRKQMEAEQADLQDELELKQLEEQLKMRDSK